MHMKKILFLVQLPPPIHGASAVNQSIKDSTLINSTFSTAYINISPAKDLTDIGKLSTGKLFSLIRIIVSSTFTFIKLKPDLVYITLSPHGFAFYKDGLIALIIKSLGGHVVFHLHGKGIEKETKSSRFKKAIYKLVFKNSNIIHLSDKLFFDINDIRDHSMSITAIPNGINSSEYVADTRKQQAVNFVYLSNLIPAKGADVLIRATNLIDRKYAERFKVKIIGKPSNNSYLQELNSLITEDTSGIITILGPKYGTEKVCELVTSDVFILPTKNDCFPLSILEAMAAGLAVISTNEGAIADIVDHGITGDIIPDTNPYSLATAMTKHIEDRAYSEACAKAALEKFNLKYTQEIFEKKLAATLIKLIEQR